MPYKSKYQRKPRTNVFHIRIGNNMDKIDLKDPAFLKILQQQYATKYLQSLGVESTSKNIFKILKQYPIENCQIVQSRLNGGLYTDTITIIPKTFSDATQSHNNEKQQVSNEMLNILDLKRIGQKKYQSNKGDYSNNPNINYSSMNNQNVGNYSQQDLLLNDDSILGSSNHENYKKGTSINNSNFRVKNGNRTNSNGFLSIDKSASIVGQRSGASLFGNYDQIGFSKLKKPNSQQNKQDQNKNQRLKFISFDIQDIKSRYIFPFNDNFKRKSNYRLQDNSNLIEPEDPKIVYEWKVFHFPFTQVRLSLNTLKELQNPIDAKMSDITAFLDGFYQEFPTHIIPLAPQSSKKPQSSSLTQKNLNSSLLPQQPPNNHNNSLLKSHFATNNKSSLKSQNFNTANNILQRSNNSKTVQSNNDYLSKTNKTSQINSKLMLFTKSQIDQMFTLIRSESMVKMIGVFLHLSYWIVFGGVNPIQIQSNMKKKMYIMMYETIEYFKIKTQNKKLWSILIFPMVLLILKMAAHYFFTIQYPKIFQSEDAKKLEVDELVLDKIMYLVEKLFDQGNINGRFIFLESQITGDKATFLKDKQFISKRIFGTSPALQIMIPNPKNGKARAIMAKNSAYDRRQNMQQANQQHIKIEYTAQKLNQKRQYQQKLLSLALHKINNHLQQVKGHNSQTNPIINLKS